MKRNIVIEKQIITKKDSFWAYTYSLAIVEDRWIEAEPFIMSDPFSAYCYSKNIIKGRWSDAEPFIVKDPEYAYNYAKEVLKNKLQFNQYEVYNIKNYEQLYIGCFFE